MKLEMTGHMRMEQRMKLAPHMIQSMEILQLPILALQERIEQELNDNPVLELEELSISEGDESTEEEFDDDALEEKDLVVATDTDKAEDFQKLDSLGSEYYEHLDQSGPYRARSSGNEEDSKLQALKNAAAPPQSLYQHLTEQWRLVDASEGVKRAGTQIIDYIDNRGYLSVHLEQLHNQDKDDFSYDELQQAISLVQTLEPTGVGAGSLKECLLIQMRQSGLDMAFEAQLVERHMDALLENRLPDIAKKMHCNLETINQALEGISKLDTSPGLQISQSPNLSITPDVVVELDDDGDYIVRLVDYSLPALRLSDYYTDMAKDKHIAEQTRKFLRTNIRSAQWIIDAVEQRKNTLLRVTRAIVKHQRDFFDKGSLHLRPLPMSRVADDVGVHVATVSRAVAGKYMQCPRGILSLRKFFSGGKEDASGTERSWEAIRVQLQTIIDNEDKSKPLNDDQIRKKLVDAGFTKIARRTVAKYRGLLNIPTARFRKRY
jgi:RNA polymerase sigma-54 factor